MDDKTFLEKLDSSVLEIRKADAGKGANEVLFKTMKMLLKKIDNSETCLAKYDKFQIMQHFSSFEDIAKSAYDFFQASKGYALNEEIRQNLEATTQEVARVNAALEFIEKNDADLLKKKGDLNKINEKYERLSEEVSKLKKIKETVSDNAIKDKEREVTELEKTIKQNQKIISDFETEIKRLGSQIQDLKNTDQALSKTIAKIDIDKKAIEENITKTIETRIADIKRIYDEQNVDINDLKAEIEKYKKQYALLDDEIIKAKEEFDFYNRHLGEDSDIVLKLREYKIQSLDSFTSEIDRLESSIKTELVELDEKIKGIIEEQEKINEDISRRNGTSK